jgi:hypothetical protein
VSRIPITPPDRERLAADYAYNSVTMLGHLYGVSAYTVRRWLMQYQIPRRHSGVRVPRQDEASQ